jgi:hypothetical protein
MHTATLLPDGKVLIVGGYTATTGSRLARLASAELYDPSTGTFSFTGSMSAAHVCHSATLLGNGKVLIAGDSQDLIGHSTIAELYDPATGTFALTGPHADPVGDSPLCPKATLLPDGRVLIASAGDSAELYDPGDGTFRATGRTSLWGEDNFDATVLMNGKVLAAGNGDSNKAQLYDPASGVFTDTGNMNTGRSILTATLLPDGTSLVAGDQFYRTPSVAQSRRATGELYDPANGTFTLVGNMTRSGRVFSTATLLANGSVLIAGGESAGASTEIFWPEVLVAPPVLFSVSGDQGEIMHAGTNRLVSASDPAVTDEDLDIYGSGLFDGGVIPPQVAIGGRSAEVLFFGKVPGLSAVNQIKVRVPSGVTPGSEVPVRLTYLSRASNEVKIGVQ